MALVALFLFRVLIRGTGNFAARLVGGVCAEVWMVLGYFLFEGFLYGFAPSVVNIPANAMQGVAGVVIGCILIKVLEKTRIVKETE